MNGSIDSSIVIWFSVVVIMRGDEEAPASDSLRVYPIEPGEAAQESEMLESVTSLLVTKGAILLVRMETCSEVKRVGLKNAFTKISYSVYGARPSILAEELEDEIILESTGIPFCTISTIYLIAPRAGDHWIETESKVVERLVI